MQNINSALLPQEIRALIFSFVNSKDLYTNVARVSKFALECARNSLKEVQVEDATEAFAHLTQFKTCRR